MHNSTVRQQGCDTGHAPTEFIFGAKTTDIFTDFIPELEEILEEEELRTKV
jgi:hypothetical protein